MKKIKKDRKEDEIMWKYELYKKAIFQPSSYYTDRI